MKRQLSGSILVISLLVMIVIVVMLPPGTAGALQPPTPTPAPLGDFVIPTSTPASASGGGLAIPTATPASGGGGLVIPTATPNSAAPAGPGLPRQDDGQLTALNLQPGDVPADFAANQSIDSFSADVMSSTIRDAGYGDVADLFDQIVQTYGWQNSVGVTYTSCQPSVPISEIYSEVGQFASPDAGRGFFEDAQVATFFGDLGYTLQPAGTVHGWSAVQPPDAGVCFAQEIEYSLFFEYWGLFFTISMKADANTDPGLVNGLLDQLAVVLAAKADAIAPTPFPSTPVPGGPGPNVPTPKPTQAALMPTPKPTQAAPPTQAAAATTLQDIQRAMPTLAESGLPSPPFQRNTQLSSILTAQQIVDQLNTLGFSQLANVTAQGAQRDGLVGLVAEVWDTGNDCPQTIGISLEVDVSLFQTSQGALTNLNDSAIQQAWIGSGIISNFQASGNGLLATGTFNHNCGAVAYYEKLVPHGRFVVAAAGIVYADANAQDIVNSMDALVNFTIQKLDQAGLQ